MSVASASSSGRELTEAPGLRLHRSVSIPLCLASRQARRHARGDVWQAAVLRTDGPRGLGRGRPGAGGLRSGTGGLIGGQQLLTSAADQIGRAPCAAAPRAAAASCSDRGSAGTPCAAAAHADPWECSTASLSRVMRFSGFLPLWYIAVAVAIGEGRNACTWSARKPLRLSHSASSSMSSSVVPGCAAMKYGIRYCSLPASFE